VGNNYIYLLTLGPLKGSSRDHQNIYNVGVMVAEMAVEVSNFSLFLRGRLKLQSAKAEGVEPHHRRHRYPMEAQTLKYPSFWQ